MACGAAGRCAFTACCVWGQQPGALKPRATGPKDPRVAEKRARGTTPAPAAPLPRAPALRAVAAAAPFESGTSARRHHRAPATRIGSSNTKYYHDSDNALSRLGSSITITRMTRFPDSD